MMKKSLLSIAAALFVMAGCKKAEDKALDNPPIDTTTVGSAEAETAPVAMDSAAMEKAWNDYMMPGDVHKVLAGDVGNWKCESKMWMDPSQEPQVSMMTASIKMLYDGRYQQAEYKGKVMGMPFQGTGTMGFNNASGKVESTWFDNMSTGMMYATGNYDSANKTFHLSGEMADPMTKKNKKFRETYSIVDDNTRKMIMFDTDESGREYKSMEITMTRM